MTTTQFKTYRSRPVIIEAVEITEDINQDIYAFVGDELMYWKSQDMTFSCSKNPQVGDFIIKQSPDDIYLCPRDVFMAKYAPVTDWNRPVREVTAAYKVKEADNV